jgi:hypothetical protein
MTVTSPAAVDLGYCEGDICNRSGCLGTIAMHETENCSCHINPPCAYCTAPRNFCPDCDWQEKDDPLVVMEVTTICLPSGWTDRKKRILDPTKIDYRIEMHSNSSQLCIGVYPPDATRQEVEKIVRGTFGGRFNKFNGGHFEYVAYTD